MRIALLLAGPVVFDQVQDLQILEEGVGGLATQTEALQVRLVACEAAGVARIADNHLIGDRRVDARIPRIALRLALPVQVIQCGVQWLEIFIGGVRVALCAVMDITRVAEFARGVARLADEIFWVVGVLVIIVRAPVLAEPKAVSREDLL